MKGLSADREKKGGTHPLGKPSHPSAVMARHRQISAVQTAFKTQISMLVSSFPTTMTTVVLALKLRWGEGKPSWRWSLQPCRDDGDSWWKCPETRIISLLPLPPSIALETHHLSSCKRNKKQKRQLYWFLQGFVFFLSICEHSPLYRGYK